MAPGEELERIDTRIFERVGMVTRMKK
jgi:hypothetical protein